jgi:hypothetical protein
MIKCRVINSIQAAPWAGFSPSRAVVFPLLNFVFGLAGSLVAWLHASFFACWLVLVIWDEKQYIYPRI